MLCIVRVKTRCIGRAVLVTTRAGLSCPFVRSLAPTMPCLKVVQQKCNGTCHGLLSPMVVQGMALVLALSIAFVLSGQQTFHPSGPLQLYTAQFRDLQGAGEVLCWDGSCLCNTHTQREIERCWYHICDNI